MEKTNFEVRYISDIRAVGGWSLDLVLTWDKLAQDTVGKHNSLGRQHRSEYFGGKRTGSAPDNRRFLRMARGSLYETRHWLRRAYHRKLLTETEVNFLSPSITELTPKLNSYLRKVDVTVTGNRKDTI